MTINHLKTILPPPKITIEADSHNWSGIEERLAISLPADFKIFAETYGTGKIGDFLWVLNPCSTNNNLNLDKILYFHEAYEEMKKLFPEDYTRPSFPQHGSFLTWAVSDNGDSLFWVIDGASDDWKVGIHSPDQGDEELTDMTTSDFLANLVSKQISSNIFPDDFLIKSKTFSSVLPS